MRGKIKEILILAQQPDSKNGTISFEDFWSDQILSYQREEIEKVENPYNFDIPADRFLWTQIEEFRQAILAQLK